MSMIREYHNHKLQTIPDLQIRVRIVKLFSLFLILNICCGYSEEPSQRDGSFENPKHMFKLVGKKTIQFYANKIALSGSMKPMAPRGRATQQSRDTRKTNKEKQLAVSLSFSNYLIN